MTHLLTSLFSVVAAIMPFHGGGDDLRHDRRHQRPRPLPLRGYGAIRAVFARALTDLVLDRDGLLAVAVPLLMPFAFTHQPWIHTLFHTAHLDAAARDRIVLAGLLVLPTVAAEKPWWRRRERAAEQP